MTARKASFRGRRSNGGGSQVPPWIAKWFAGERRVSFTAACPPHCFRLHAYWQTWLEDHPGASPPAGLQLRLENPARLPDFMTAHEHGPIPKEAE